MSEDSPSLLGRIAAYTEILVKDHRSTVFVSLAEAYRQLGMLDDALDIATKGTINLPGFSPGYTALGRIQAQRGDFAAASEAFQRALTIEKSNLLALKGLARVRLRQGRTDEARMLVLQVLELSPTDQTAQQLLAKLPAATLESGAHDQIASASVLSQPVGATVAPVTPVTPTGKLAGPVELATEKSGRSAESHPPLRTETLADLYRKQGLVLEAMKIYRDLLRANPQNEQVRNKLAAIKREMEAAMETSEAEPPQAPAVAERKPDAGPVLHGGVNAAQLNVVASQVREPVLGSVPATPGTGGEVLTAGTTPLAMFEMWLRSIEKRRAHVQ